ncbi:aminopeptidase [Oricola nitratireducens]|uniref:aminopeptidase n=1 Tax=Oricola nitratireducens TaxID=2775868 RepID=UPI001867D9AF|nr:aminopeptidase [Oricola nitratireducens]
MYRAFFRSMAAAVLLLVLTGCTGISYYAQSLNGHIRMISARQKVERLIDDPSEPSALRAQLELASDIRRFATGELALPDNNSYRVYVDTHRDFVTWAVFAAPEFSLNARSWCFPLYGCVPYRGYFSREAASRFAAGIERQGLDVYISGVTAYSTLGLFSDPLLNTMLRHDETYLAGLVFHELAHQRFYVRGDTAFNEAFAVAVETTGVKKWLRRRHETAALRRYEAGRKREADFLALVAEARNELKAVYGGSGDAEQKRVAKEAVIENLRLRYRRLRDGRWGGYDGYDAWFDSPINNAKLAATGFYNDLAPAFVHLLDVCSGDYPDFYAAVARLGALDRDKRHDALKAAKSCD